jgi:putative membrane protein
VTVGGLIFAGLAALIHVYIFVLESVQWTAPATRKTFGTSAEEAEATKEMAYNQGFYNLFLAIVTVTGIVLIALDQTAAGAALVFAGAGSMVAAGLVLITSSPSKARSALIQLVPPAIGVVALILGLAL